MPIRLAVVEGNAGFGSGNAEQLQLIVFTVLAQVTISKFRNTSYAPKLKGDKAQP
jgi:hypothetical protein